MKKKQIIFLICLLSLGICSIFIFLNLKPKVEEKNMNVEFINDNYIIDLFENKENNKINLTAKAKYIGAKEVIKQPEITLSINCLYTYTDTDESYTDSLNGTIILKNNKNELIGNTSIDISKDELDGYSCLYKIDSTTGIYNNK